MMVTLVREGFDRDACSDMDVVSFCALYNAVMSQRLEEQAHQTTLAAVASQGDPKGIKDTVTKLRKAAGNQKPSGKGLSEFTREVR